MTTEELYLSFLRNALWQREAPTHYEQADWRKLMRLCQRPSANKDFYDFR